MADMENEKGVEVKDSKKKKKDKKPNIFVRMFKRIKRFFFESISELKKVTWLSKTETRKSSLLVFASVIAISVAIGIVDLLLTLAIQGLGNLFY